MSILAADIFGLKAKRTVLENSVPKFPSFVREEQK